MRAFDWRKIIWMRSTAWSAAARGVRRAEGDLRTAASGPSRPGPPEDGPGPCAGERQRTSTSEGGTKEVGTHPNACRSAMRPARRQEYSGGSFDLGQRAPAAAARRTRKVQSRCARARLLERRRYPAGSALCWHAGRQAPKSGGLHRAEAPALRHPLAEALRIQFSGKLSVARPAVLSVPFKARA